MLTFQTYSLYTIKNAGEGGRGINGINVTIDNKDWLITLEKSIYI